MKKILFILWLSVAFNAGAQIKTYLSDERPFRPDPEKGFVSYFNEWNDFLLFRRMENTEQIFGLILTAEEEIVLTSDLRVATQVGDNHFTLAGLALAGRNLTAFVQSHNTLTGRNVMAMQAVDNKGGLTSEGMLVGYFDFKSPDDPGIWHIASSPDRKHIALIAQLPYEEGKARMFRYFFMNENLTITHKGEFSAGKGQGPLQLSQFLPSDSGELYLIARGREDRHNYPVVLKASVQSGSCSEVPLTPLVKAGYCQSYQAKINASGHLIIAGYITEERQPAPDGLRSGSWYYDASVSPDVTVNTFARPVAGLNAHQLLFNGNTYFLTGMSASGIAVTGFSYTGSAKFDRFIARAAPEDKLLAGVAAGILQQQLCLVYNTVPGLGGTAKGRSLNGQQLMLNMIDNDGNQSPAGDFTKEAGEGTAALPGYFSASPEHILFPLRTKEGVRVITFR